MLSTVVPKTGFIYQPAQGHLPAGGAPGKRRWELDALRGLMLVLMTVTHLPTRLSSPLGQPFGYVSAAEGFVLLSAYMAGMVYSSIALKRGVDAMRTAFVRRAFKVYLAHAATLIFLFTVIAAIGLRIDQPAVKDLMSFYLADPLEAFFTGLLLMYAPPLLDILPMYVLFMLMSPIVLAHALHKGWRGMIAGSVVLWLLSQFGLGKWVYEAVVPLVGLHLPFHETGAFSIFSWQLLWLLGLWMGSSRVGPSVQRFVFPGWALALALAVGITGLVWRHWLGQAPFGADEALNLLFDKWHLGPLRMINLIALVILVIRFAPLLKARLPRLGWLEAIGAASLPVFCVHLMIVLLALGFLGSDPWMHPVWVDGLLLAACFAILYATAVITLKLDQQGAGKQAAAAVSAAMRQPSEVAGGAPLAEARADARQ